MSGNNSSRNLFQCVVIMVFGVLFVTVPSVLGQKTQEDIDALRERGEREGWTFTVSLNEATQYSHDQLCGLKVPPNWQEGAVFDSSSATKDLPAAFDWRNIAELPPARAQGGCGSCWAFSTIAPLECGIWIKSEEHVDLSEQWLVSCNSQGYGCDGGFLVHGYHKFKFPSTDPCGGHGAVLEADFPYVEAEPPCDCPYDHHYYIQSWAYVSGASGVPTVAQLKQAIYDYGPISVSIHVGDIMDGYSGGVFNACEVGPIDHAVALVGWDDNQGTEGIWFLRNSWGVGWGEDGYMRIEYGCCSVGYGAARVYYQPVYIKAEADLGPAPLTVDLIAETPVESLLVCNWQFGDGQTGSGDTIPHEYVLPGHYEVSATVVTPRALFDTSVQHLVSVYADTMRAATVSGAVGTEVRVDVNVHNYLDLRRIVIPFTWGDGPLYLTKDSVVTTGLRTDYFEQKTQLNDWSAERRCTWDLISSSSGSQPHLAPGDGPVLSIWFTVDSGSGVCPVSFEGYIIWDPLFETYPGEYVPVLEAGAVSSGCCIPPSVGDLDQGGGLLGFNYDGADLSLMINGLFIDPTNGWDGICLDEADIDFSAPARPVEDPMTIDGADLSLLIDALFINPANFLRNCDGTPNW
ncbi:MAG: hypothetical protein DRP45_05410 [Candidatus Zixiibacteriota bacterium]|nr:MAG: hypothetical protein DRP45_05410 [candidate division Zixibacteria bacterium]